MTAYLILEKLSPLQRKYQDFFRQKLKKHHIERLNELETFKQRRKFWLDVKQGWVKEKRKSINRKYQNKIYNR